jgi:hypothetical protein
MLLLADGANNPCIVQGALGFVQVAVGVAVGVAVRVAVGVAVGVTVGEFTDEVRLVASLCPCFTNIQANGQR